MAILNSTGVRTSQSSVPAPPVSLPHVNERKPKKKRKPPVVDPSLLPWMWQGKVYFFRRMQWYSQSEAAEILGWDSETVRRRFEGGAFGEVHWPNEEAGLKRARRMMQIPFDTLINCLTGNNVKKAGRS